MAQSSVLAAYARAGAEYARTQIVAGNGITPSSGSNSIPSHATLTLQGTFTFNFITPVLFPDGPLTLTRQYTVPLS